MTMYPEGTLIAVHLDQEKLVEYVEGRIFLNVSRFVGIKYLQT